jgi:starch synthase
MNQSDPLRVLFIASEADPFVKVGGLGDVAGSLPSAIRCLSKGQADQIDIRLAIPLHGVIRREDYNLQPVVNFDVPYKGGKLPAQVYSCSFGDLPVYLIESPLFPPGEPVYSGDNAQDGLKYTFFSLASLEMARTLGWQPHLLHANDWHTSPAVYSLSLNRSTVTFYSHTATLLTIHNLPYLGAGAELALEAFGLPAALDSSLPWWAQDLPLPLGLLTADAIVAVSPTYAREILTPEFGSGLYEFLQKRSNSILGILNGIDKVRWNPATDSALPVKFSPEALSNRDANKAALQHEFGFSEEPGTFLMAMITRMDNQKGVDLALEALQSLSTNVETGWISWQAVILGTGMPSLEETARQMQTRFPERVRAIIRFDPSLSRRLYGGADALLLPSRYEPCGLAQMIGMRYGCVPIARSIGGLRDTITDESPDDQDTGFLFSEGSPDALAEAIHRALSVYADQPRWKTLQLNGMAKDFSWDESARRYATLYRRLVDARGKK